MRIFTQGRDLLNVSSAPLIKTIFENNSVWRYYLTFIKESTFFIFYRAEKFRQIKANRKGRGE